MPRDLLANTQQTRQPRDLLSQPTRQQQPRDLLTQQPKDLLGQGPKDLLANEPNLLGKAKEVVGSYLKEAQPAFKMHARYPYEMLTGRGGEIPYSEFDRVGNAPWKQLILETYPGMERSTAGQLAAQAGGGLLEFGTRPSSYIAAGALERAIPAIAQKAVAIPGVRQFAAKHLPTFMKGALDKTALLQQDPLESMAQRQLKEIVMPRSARETNILSKVKPPKDVTNIAAERFAPGVTSQGADTAQMSLARYSDDTVKAMENLMTNHPEIKAKKTFTFAELEKMGDKLDDTFLLNKMIANEGQLAAEVIKQGKIQDATIRTTLKSSFDDIVGNIKNVLARQETTATARAGTELGRALGARKAAIQPQKEIADLLNKKIAQAQKDPLLNMEGKKRIVRALELLRKKTLSAEFNPSWFDKSYEFWLNNILSGPWTHTVNIVSNATFAGIKPFDKLLRATLDVPASWFNKGQRSHYFSEIAGQFRGLKKFAKGEKLPGGIAPGSKLDVVRPGQIKGLKGKAIRIPTKALELEDNLFKRLTGWMELGGKADTIARQEGLRGAALVARRNQLMLNPTEDISKAVMKEQLERTFQDITLPGEIVTGLPQKALRWVIPFRRTLASILTKGLERTPLGFAKVAGKAIKAKTKGAAYPQGEVVADLANALTGSAIMGGIAMGVAKGNVTGAPPKEKAKRDLFYAQGKQPYSIKIKDRWVPFSRLEPFGTAAMFMTDLIQGWRDSEGENLPARTADSLFSLARSLGNKTFLSGPINLMQAMMQPKIYGDRYVGQFGRGFVPYAGLLSNIRRAEDLGVRDPQGLPERIAEQIPGLSHLIPQRVSSLGEDVERKPVGISRYTPFPITKVQEDTVVNELVRLDKGIGFPSKTIRSIFKTKKPTKIDRKDYRRLLKGSATVIKQALDRLVTSPQYLHSNDEIRIRLIDSVVRGVRTVGREQLKQEKGIR